MAKKKPKKKPKATPAPAPVKTEAQWAQEFGTQIALVNSDPTLKTLFAQAVAGKWEPARFQAEFQNTNWYKTHADTWRTAETTRLADPASWAEQQKLAADLIRQQSAEMGFQLSDADIASLADQSLYLAAGSASGIDTSWLKSHVIEMGKLTGTGGTAIRLIDQLKQAAYNNGVSYNDSWYEAAARDVLGGTGTADAWTKQIKDVAKSKYPTLAAQLDGGMTVMDVASPYLQQMAATFELGQTDVSLNDPTIQRALTSLDDKSQPALKPLWKFQQELKQDDRYFKTNQAHQDMQGMATEIARQFGKAV